MHLYAPGYKKRGAYIPHPFKFKCIGTTDERGKESPLPELAFQLSESHKILSP